MAEEYLDVAIPRFKANEDRLNEFVNGADTDSYETSNGELVPSIRKYLKGLGSGFNDEAIKAGVEAGIGAIDDKIDERVHFFQAFVDSKGEAEGLASLGPDGKIPADQLPAQEDGGSKAPAFYTKTDGRNATKLFARETAANEAFAYNLTSVASSFNTNYDAGNYIAQHVRHVAEGTNKNGPRGAALGMGISMFKEGFGTGTAKGGEIDALYIVLRQDSPRTGAQGINDPNRGDGCGILIDAAVHKNVGFVGGIEGATSVLPDSGTGTERRLVYQVGCTDTTTPASVGYFTSAAQGRHSAGIVAYAAENDGGYFEHFLQCRTDTVGLFNVDRNGVVSLGRRLNNGQMIDLSMHMTVQADYSLAWLNANRSVALLNLDQSGNLSAIGGIAGSAINSASNIQAVGNIIAGGRVQATILRLNPSGAAADPAEFKAGTLSVGASGRLRYCEADGVQPKFVTLSVS